MQKSLPPENKNQESRQENRPKAEKGEDRRNNRIRQHNKRADRKVESNDSPEIPDSGRHHKCLASLWGKVDR